MVSSCSPWLTQAWKFGNGWRAPVHTTRVSAHQWRDNATRCRLVGETVRIQADYRGEIQSLPPRRPCVLLLENRWVHEWTGWKSSRSAALIEKRKEAERGRGGGRSVSAGMGRGQALTWNVTAQSEGVAVESRGEWAAWINTETFLSHTLTHACVCVCRCLGDSDTCWSRGNLERLQKR